MLVDALLAADPVLKMTERIHDPREFIKMDDTLLKQVEQYGLLHPHWESSEEAGPIAAAQKIITRLLSILQGLTSTIACLAGLLHSHTGNGAACHQALLVELHGPGVKQKP